MRNKTTSSLIFTNFTRALSALMVTTTVACAGSVTPPDSTPVYANEIAPGVAPIEVEHQSTNRPAPEKVSSDSGEEVAPEEKNSESSTPAPSTATPKESTPADDSSSPEAKPEAPPVTKSAPPVSKDAAPKAPAPTTAPSKKGAGEDG